MADYTDVLKLSALPTLEARFSFLKGSTLPARSLQVKTGFKPATKASFFDATAGTATTRPTTGGQIYPRTQ
jgi:hypothetical protein